MTRVIDVRTSGEADLEQVLQSLHEQTRTGTLKLSGPDGRIKYVYFKRGTIELLKTTRSRTLLGKALLKRRKLTYEQLLAALERQKAANRPLRLGEILVGMGIVLESDVHQALAYQIAEEVFELFTWPEARSEFFRGEPPLDIFDPEDLQARVSLSPVQLAREAVRRQKELQEIQRTIPSLRDVFVPQDAAREREENQQNPAVQELLTCLDGQRSVDELLELVRAPDLVALRTLAKLKSDGDAQPLPGRELIALGELLENQGEFERARQRYLRAEELHTADFDLPRRIGQIAEALGDIPEASRRYMTYADRCDQAGYPEVAAQTLARVVEMDPSLSAARERWAELLAKTARTLQQSAPDQARERLAQAVEIYEQLLTAEQTPEEQQRLLEVLRELQPERLELRERMAELALLRGDVGQAIEDYQELAMLALEEGDLPGAIRLLQRILEIEPGEILALQSLAATYARMGRKDEAVAQYLRFARSFEEAGLASAGADTLIEIYEKVAELDPDNTPARMFLARAYSQKAETDKSAQNLQSMVESLRRSGREEELLEALDRLHEVKPLDAQQLLERARLARKLGKEKGEAAGFRQVAEAAARAGDAALARQAWGEVLGALPGDLEAHLALGRLEQQDKQEEAAARRFAASFELAMLAGRHDLAEEAVKRALDCEPDRPAHRERLARLYVVRGKVGEAVKTLVRAARGSRDDEDFGVARAWARRALELDPACEDARDLLENLRRAVGFAPPPAQADQSGLEPRAEELDRPLIVPTITGGPKVASIEGLKQKNKSLAGTLNKLRALKGGGPAEGGGESEEQAAPGGISKGPEAPGDAAEVGVSKKATSAMSRLRALKSGGEAPPAHSGRGLRPGRSEESSSELPTFAASEPSAGGGEAVPESAPAAQKSTQRISKGPEAPGDPADAAVSQKASSALSKLRALKSGGGAAGDASGSEERLASAPAGQKISKGPEAPGDPADAAVSQKASSALSKLKALKSGGGGAGASGSEERPAQKISKGPEAPGDAADAATAQKASSAMSRLKALKSGGGAASFTPAPVVSTPEPAAPAPEPAPEPAVAAAALGDGGSAAAIFDGSSAEGTPVVASGGPLSEDGSAGGASAPKASSALSRLKALKSGGGGGAAPVPQQISKGPEAPGDPADAAVSQKASSALSKLKALKSGGGLAPTPTAPPAVSKGPEAPGDAADPATSQKATSALSKLKALKSGGGGPAPAPAPEKISKGPEAPGDPASAEVSQKASTAMSRLRSLRGGSA